MMTIDEAMRVLLAARDAEALARDARVDAENAVLAMVPGPLGSSRTFEAAGVKASARRPVRTTLDVPAWDGVKATIAPELWPVRYKPEVVARAWHALPTLDPAAWEVCRPVIEDQPGKPAITILRMDQ